MEQEASCWRPSNSTNGRRGTCISREQDLSLFLVIKNWQARRRSGGKIAWGAPDASLKAANCETTAALSIL